MEHFVQAFGLGFDVEKEPSRTSGFRPARFHEKTNLPLLADLRLEGFAAALESGFCENLLIVAGDEERYPDEAINQAWAIEQMLVKDRGIEPRRVTSARSAKGTAGNVAVLKEKMAVLGTTDIPVITNGYHLLRTARNFRRFSPSPLLVSAEELWLAAASDQAEQDWRRAFILQRFEEDLPARMAADLNGLSQDLRGTYVSSYERARL